MVDFVKYTTKEGDRWDLIAYRAYGDANKAAELMLENPSVAADPILDSGLVLKVPVFEGIEETFLDDLPPWKR